MFGSIKETSCKEADERLHVFSAIGRIQQAHTITYGVYPKGNQWRITVQDSNAGFAKGAVLAVNKDLALQLRDFLYENAVPAENWQDVLADVLPESVCQMIQVQE